MKQKCLIKSVDQTDSSSEWLLSGVKHWNDGIQWLTDANLILGLQMTNKKNELTSIKGNAPVDCAFVFMGVLLSEKVKKLPQFPLNITGAGDRHCNTLHKSEDWCRVVCSFVYCHLAIDNCSWNLWFPEVCFGQGLQFYISAISFLTEQQGEISLFVLSQLVSVSFVAFSSTWP